MQLSISDQSMKEMISEVLIDMMKNRKAEFIELFEEAIEEIGLANAIIEGKKDNLVSINEIFQELDR